MNTTTVELYDIKPLPHFLFSPGTWEWCLAVTILLFLALALWVWIRARSKLKLDPYRSICGLIDSIGREEISREHIHQISLALRRFLSFQEHAPYYSLGRVELQNLQSESPSILLKELINLLISAEDQLYRPTIELNPEFLKNLTRALSAYHASREARDA